jgi:hypothetical protein
MNREVPTAPALPGQGAAADGGTGLIASRMRTRYGDAATRA